MAKKTSLVYIITEQCKYFQRWTELRKSVDSEEIRNQIKVSLSPLDR